MNGVEGKAHRNHHLAPVVALPQDLADKLLIVLVLAVDGGGVPESAALRSCEVSKAGRGGEGEVGRTISIACRSVFLLSSSLAGP